MPGRRLSSSQTSLIRAKNQRACPVLIRRLPWNGHSSGGDLQISSGPQMSNTFCASVLHFFSSTWSLLSSTSLHGLKTENCRAENISEQTSAYLFILADVGKPCRGVFNSKRAFCRRGFVSKGDEHWLLLKLPEFYLIRIDVFLLIRRSHCCLHRRWFPFSSTNMAL